MLMDRISHMLRCGQQVLDLSSPIVMGILNITPDSFYAPSRVNKITDQIVDRAGQMLEEGARILDIGGMSTRPGSIEIDIQEEIDRVVPAITALSTAFPQAILSIDTYRSEVASVAINAGVTMVNDISGGNLDERMIDVLALSKVSYVLMHMKGRPSDMQSQADYQDLMGDLVKYFVNKLRILHNRGVRDIIIDPGFGFSKTMEQNYEIIRQLQILRFLDCPVMIGLSRKSTLSQTIGRPAEETIHATTALHMVALQHGASILRVHDVRPAIDAIAVFNKLHGT